MTMELIIPGMDFIVPGTVVVVYSFATERLWSHEQPLDANSSSQNSVVIEFPSWPECTPLSCSFVLGGDIPGVFLCHILRPGLTGARAWLTAMSETDDALADAV